jgi:hypothetical protein
MAGTVEDLHCLIPAPVALLVTESRTETNNRRNEPREKLLAWTKPQCNTYYSGAGELCNEKLVSNDGRLDISQ